VYVALKSKINRAALQEHLHKLEIGIWNPVSCHSCNKNNIVINTQYLIHGQILETIPQTKHIGITTTSVFRWNAHINNMSFRRDVVFHITYHVNELTVDVTLCVT